MRTNAYLLIFALILFNSCSNDKAMLEDKTQPFSLITIDEKELNIYLAIKEQIKDEGRSGVSSALDEMLKSINNLEDSINIIDFFYNKNLLDACSDTKNKLNKYKKSIELNTNSTIDDSEFLELYLYFKNSSMKNTPWVLKTSYALSDSIQKYLTSSNIVPNLIRNYIFNNQNSSVALLTPGYIYVPVDYFSLNLIRDSLRVWEMKNDYKNTEFDSYINSAIESDIVIFIKIDDSSEFVSEDKDFYIKNLKKIRESMNELENKQESKDAKINK